MQAVNAALKYRLVIFDFDGTLADSFPWFQRVLNDVADKYRFRRVAPDQVEALRRMPAREILKHLGVPDWKVPLIANHMRRLKAEPAGGIALFAGVDAMLRELKAAGLMLAIVSSDAEDNVRRTLGAANAGRIDAFACGASLFGKAAKFRRVLKRTGVAPEAAIAVGDEMRDADAASDAGIAFGAVAWGYASIEALATRHPGEIFTSVEDMAARLSRRVVTPAAGRMP
jgi:phosphoglycolate phosphatase